MSEKNINEKGNSKEKQLKGGLFSRRKYEPLFIETHRTARGVSVLNLYFRVSGKIGLGASGGRPFFTVSKSSRKG